MHYLHMANGVRHTEKINSYTKNLTNKKAWFVTQSNIFISKKSTQKIEKSFFSKFHTQFTYYDYISNN